MKKIAKYGVICLIIIIVLMLILLGINLYVKSSTKNQIIENNYYSNLKDIDCIVVLGAGIWGDKPSPMLEDRLLQAIDLYQNNVSSKIIMSGDHGKQDYDEVNTMKNFAIDKGVPSESILIASLSATGMTGIDEAPVPPKIEPKTKTRAELCSDRSESRKFLRSFSALDALSPFLEMLRAASMMP